MKRRMRRRKRNGSRTSPFSMTISTFNSTFTTTTITSNSTFNLNLTLFEPHPTPPFHSPRNPHSPLSSPYPLSPHILLAEGTKFLNRCLNFTVQFYKIMKCNNVTVYKLQILPIPGNHCQLSAGFGFVPRFATSVYPFPEMVSVSSAGE